MTTPIPFVPTPRLAYTEKYNRQKENMRLDMLERKRTIENLEAMRLKEYHEALRIEENRKMKELMEDMSEEEAYEYFDYNIIGGYFGEQNPVFLSKLFHSLSHPK